MVRGRTGINYSTIMDHDCMNDGCKHEPWRLHEEVVRMVPYHTSTLCDTDTSSQLVTRRVVYALRS